MLGSLIKADTQYIDKKHSGKFISNLTYDVGHITNLLSVAILNLFKDSLTLIGLLFVMFTQNWKLSLISIIMIPLQVQLLEQWEKEWAKLLLRLKKNQVISQHT